MRVWSSAKQQPRLKLNTVHAADCWLEVGAEAQKPKGAGIREPKIRDEWLSRWGIMGNSPLSEGMASRGNSEEDRFRPDERGSWLSTLLLCVGSGSAGKSSTRRGESSKGERRGRWGEARRGKTMNGGETGEKEMTWKQKKRKKKREKGRREEEKRRRG